MEKAQSAVSSQLQHNFSNSVHQRRCLQGLHVTRLKIPAFEIIINYNFIKQAQLYLIFHARDFQPIKLIVFIFIFSFLAYIFLEIHMKIGTLAFLGWPVI